MNYNLGDVELSINDEYMLKEEIEKRAGKPSESNIYYFEKAKEGYKNFDFSCLSEFDKYDIDSVREKFQADSALCERPLLFIMYIMNRNGFLGDYFKDKSRVVDLSKKDINRRDISDNLPEAIITDDGMLYGIGKDGHIWLYNFLNLSGINTTDCVRYGNFTEPGQTQRHQYFSKLKEFEGDNKNLYISEMQAIAINNLRKKYEPLTSLQDLLLNKTADLGFRTGDSLVAFKINFETFADTFPEEHMNRSDVLQIRKSRDMFAQGKEK